jgi:L-fucose isomerase
MTEISRRMENGIYDEVEHARALRWVRDNCREGEDRNARPASRAEQDATWDDVVKMSLIVRDLMDGNEALARKGHSEESMGRNAIAAGFQGAREWTDFMPNGDFVETILNTSFDWNGCRPPYVLATENDALNAASMLLGHLLSHTAQIFTDVRTYWSPDAVRRVTGKKLPDQARDGVIHLINSGPTCLDASGCQMLGGRPAMKPSWEISDCEMQDCLAATKFYPANRAHFPKGGFSTNFLTKPGMEVTMSRINLVKGLGPVLQIVEGMTVELPEEIHGILDARTDPTLPTTWFVPRLTAEGAFRNVYTVMAGWGSNHAAVSGGHIGRDLLTLASMLRIPVSMHNVEETEIFRPAVWSQFGADALQSADYLACRTYGPIYG